MVTKTIKVFEWRLSSCTYVGVVAAHVSENCIDRLRDPTILLVLVWTIQRGFTTGIAKSKKTKKNAATQATPETDAAVVRGETGMGLFYADDVKIQMQISS